MAEIIPMLILLLTLSLAFAAEPGVKFVVTKKGLDYVGLLTGPVFRTNLETMSIPDQSGSEGPISWKLKNISISGISGPDAHISLNPGAGGVTLAISNFSLNLNSDWDAKYWIVIEFPASGRVTLSVLGASLTLVAELGEKNGRPSVFAKSCSCNIGDIGVTFHDGLVAVILNLLNGFIRNKIKTLLEDKICEVVIEQVNTQTNKSGSRLKVNVDIAKNLTLDYSLTGAPTITDKYIEFATKGTIYFKDDRQESPFTPAALPALTDFSKMVYIFVTEASANTFLFTAHKNGYITYNVPVDTLKDNYTNYKHELRISSASAPSMKFEKQKLTVAVVANVEVVVYTPDGELYLHEHTVSVLATVQTFIVNKNLVANITDYSFKNDVVKSCKVDMKEQDLKRLIRETIDDVVLPEINNLCKQGIPLPGTDIFRLYNSQLSQMPGYIQVATDVEYLN